MPIFAGNHGVVKQGISPFPPEYATDGLEFRGWRAARQLCETAGLALEVAIGLNADD